jgi:hypothetical protein
MEMDRPAILTPASQASASRARNLLLSVNAASDTSQTVWLIFLLLMAYFVIALGSVSDKDLLLNAPITLPLLGIDMSLDRFFLFAPPILILLHLGVLMQYVVTTRKTYAFLQIAEAQEIADTAATGKPSVYPMRHELSSNFFTQFLAGPPESGLVLLFFQVIVFGTLVILPVCVLLAFQITFLPFHDVTTTWLHRIYTAIDVILIALLGVFLPSSENNFWKALGAGIASYPGFYAFTVLSFTGLLFFSWAVATIPGEWMDRTLATRGMAVELEASGTVQPAPPRLVFAPTALFFEGPVNPATGRASSFLHRNLIVMDENLAGLKPPADGAALSFRYRDLQFARLDRSDLRGADFTCANLYGAVLDADKIAGAKFGC